MNASRLKGRAAHARFTNFDADGMKELLFRHRSLRQRDCRIPAEHVAEPVILLRPWWLRGTWVSKSRWRPARNGDKFFLWNVFHADGPIHTWVKCVLRQVFEIQCGHVHHTKKTLGRREMEQLTSHRELIDSFHIEHRLTRQELHPRAEPWWNVEIAERGIGQLMGCWQMSEPWSMMGCWQIDRCQVRSCLLFWARNSWGNPSLEPSNCWKWLNRGLAQTNLVV